MTDENIFHLELGEPSAFGREVALNELRETPDNKEKGLVELKRLLELETHICVPLNNELWLMNFLRICKFYPESAKDRVLLYLKTKKECLERLRKTLTYNDVKSMLERNVFSIVKQRDQLGRRMIIQKMENWPRDLNVYELLAAFGMILNVLRLEPETQIHGYVYIFDLQNISFWQLTQLTPNYLELLTKTIVLQPARLKNYHLINNPYVFKPIFHLVMKFLPEKIRSRVLLHGNDPKALSRFISTKCIPECYGGSLTGQWWGNSEFCNLMEQYAKDRDDFRNCGFKNE